MQKVVQLMWARDAGDKAIAMFLKDMQAEYPTQTELQIQTKQQIKELALSKQIEKRMAGELPLIDINGTNFMINLRLGELRKQKSPLTEYTLHEI